MKHTPLVVLAVLLATSPLLAGQPDSWRVYPGKLPKSADGLRWNIDACVAACRQHADPTSKQAWQAARPTLELQLRQAIGLDPWPEKTPLDARITGRADRDGYSVENLLFQSMPDFYVTANVYVPKDAPRPLPAVVVTAGHAMADGKNYDLYRTAQLDLVRQGFLVLAYDPIGQGERRLPGNSHPLSYPALLVGQTNLRYMLWDSIRSLDYLLTRPDVDPKRIGITGNSGGGLNTMYAMPIEPRFAAGAAFCCPCSYEIWIRDGGNHCICNHLPGICRHMEQFQFIGLCAPRPFLVGTGQLDPIFPVAGIRDTIRRAKTIYSLYDASDRLALVEAPFKHGWTQPLREACCGWFDRWLQDRGDGSPVPETALKLEDKDSPDLKALKDGHMPSGAKTYLDLIRQEAARQIASYAPIPTDKEARAAWAKNLRARLWEIFGGRPRDFTPTAKTLGQFTVDGHTALKLAIQTEPDLEVPAVLLLPKGQSAKVPAVILLSDDGKSAWCDSQIPRRLLADGIAVLAMDVRGLGEGKVHENHVSSDAIVLGRPLLAQQAWDALCAARALAQRDDIAPKRVAIYAKGNVGLIALVAAALDDQLAAVATEGTIDSLLDAMADPLPLPMWAYAPNLLRIANVPQLLALVAPRPLLWLNPIGEGGKPLKSEPTRQQFQPVAAANGAAQAIITDKPSDQILTFLKTALHQHP